MHANRTIHKRLEDKRKGLVKGINGRIEPSPKDSELLD